MRLILLAPALLLTVSNAFAQTKATQVMAILTVNPGVERERITKVMPSEVRATVQMYLDGHIQQWFARGDGKGVVFLLDCKTVTEAKELMGSLPLSKEKLATFEYMPLGPLSRLRYLLTPPAQ